MKKIVILFTSKIKRNKKKVIFFVLIFPLVFLFGSNIIIELSTRNQTFVDISKIKKNKVGLLLGAAKTTNGRINLYFKYRVDAAVKLFKSGKIEYILVSGDNRVVGYDEPSDFKNELIKRGIPASKIFLDYAGFRTLDSVVRAKEIFGQTSITIISQEFHNERAIFLAKSFGMKAIGFNAKQVKGKSGKRVIKREYFARAKVFVDLLFGVEPKFLGKKIRIK